MYYGGGSYWNSKHLDVNEIIGYPNEMNSADIGFRVTLY